MITKFKYENIIFITLVAMYIIGAFSRECSLAINLTTLMSQVLMCVGVKEVLKYVRRNATEIKKTVSDMLTD